MDQINHPNHYKSHPSGVEAIEICEHLGFNLGNAFKYLFRRDVKHESPIADLRKARWYLERELFRRSNTVVLKLQAIWRMLSRPDLHSRLALVIDHEPNRRIQVIMADVALYFFEGNRERLKDAIVALAFVISKESIAQ